MREKRAVADADGRVRLGECALGGRDVGTALDKLRGHAGGNRGRRVEHRLDGNGKIGRYLAQQHGDGVFILRAQQAHIRRRRLRGFQRRLGLGNGDVIADAGVELGLGVVQRFLVRGDGLIQNLLQHILAANLEEILGQAGLFGELLGLKIGGAHLRGVLRLVDLVADLAPEIGRPRNVERRIPEARSLFRSLPREETLLIAGALRPVP